MEEAARRKYYSQYGEDLLLWALFGDQRTGFFVDVGAFDGIHYSNTLSFEQQGWTGICIEAHPDYYPLCEKARPGSACIFAACVGPAHADHATILTEPLGLLSGISASGTPNLAFRYARRNMEFPGLQPIEVPAMSLDEVLARYPPPAGGIDFLSIDVEGTELDVLAGFSGVARVIVVEANTAEAGEALVSYLNQRGYTLARALGVNLFFARERSDVQALRMARVSGTTERTLHPLGAEATLHDTVGKSIQIEPFQQSIFTRIHNWFSHRSIGPRS